MFELFDHTADLGLRVTAPDLDALFEDAALGLFSIIVEQPPRGGPLEQEFELRGQRHDHLLFDWLSELLYVFDTARILFGEFEVRVGPEGLRARARGERLDPACHRLLHEVKAITYHGLKVERVGSGWRAEVIVDI
jgi:SHS2 domain-containing protein